MGLLRVVLALSVIIGHAASPLGDYWGIGAFYAVNMFFMISGFYMALILNEKYSDPNHNTIFYMNRALRIYPTYLVGILLSIMVIFATGDFHRVATDLTNMNIGEKIFFVLSNLFVFGQDLSYVFNFGVHISPIGSSLNPPSWSIAVELMFYLIAPFIFRSSRKVLVTLVLGCMYFIAIKHVVFPINDISFMRTGVEYSMMQYYFFPSSVMFFALGGVSYHFVYKHVFVEKKMFSNLQYLVGIMILLIISRTVPIIPWYHAVFFVFMISSLFMVTKNIEFDRKLGELSYSIYIIHFPILLFVKKFLWGKIYGISFGAYIVTFLTLVISIVVYKLVERPIDRYRQLKAIGSGQTS